jgi:hypothetical protein
MNVRVALSCCVNGCKLLAPGLCAAAVLSVAWWPSIVQITGSAKCLHSGPQLQFVSLSAPVMFYHKEMCNVNFKVIHEHC